LGYADGSHHEYQRIDHDLISDCRDHGVYGAAQIKDKNENGSFFVGAIHESPEIHTDKSQSVPTVSSVIRRLPMEYFQTKNNNDKTDPSASFLFYPIHISPICLNFNFHDAGLTHFHISFSSKNPVT